LRGPADKKPARLPGVQFFPDEKNSGTKIIMPPLINRGLHYRCGSILVSQYFQSIGRAPVALLIAMTRQVVFQIPQVLLLPLLFGYDGVLFAGPKGDALAFFVAAALMRRELRRLRQAAGDECAADPDAAHAA
jgi:hypothetical protein